MVSRCLDILNEINELVKAAGWPVWISPSKQGLVDEHLKKAFKVSIVPT